VAWLRARNTAPHIVRIEGRRAPGLDGRATPQPGYLISQRTRKRIEKIFGWMKTVGGLRRSRFVGIAKTQLAAYLLGAAYNLLRMARMQPAPGWRVHPLRESTMTVRMKREEPAVPTSRGSTVVRKSGFTRHSLTAC
jgi:hypothetical protein